MLPKTKNAGRMPALQKINAPRDREAQYSTEILYRNDDAEQIKKTGEKKVKTGRLKTDGCATPSAVCSSADFTTRTYPRTLDRISEIMC